MQCIRELVMIEEEKEKQDNAEDNEDDGEEDEDGMIDDDDEEEEDEDEDVMASSKKAKAKAGKSVSPHEATPLERMAVPEGGYDEEEDCRNVEDEEYRQVID